MRAGRYLLEEVIGVGSFATVHRARDERLDDTVVVKILAENHSLNPEIRERFIAEGRALRRVSSPHVVEVHDIGESDRQQPYLVLEHADRGTLADRVEQLRRRGWTATREDVLTVSRQLAAALRAVHSAQLVHRDLSPANVLLATDPERSREPVAEPGGGDGRGGRGSQVQAGALLGPDERLVVADLGMCKDLALNSGLTVAGGTAGYRPPEMDGGPAVIDTRADLWSLSALVRWLVEGADLPPEVDRVLERGQSADPQDRQPDIETWSAQMEQALAPPPAPEASRTQTGTTAHPAAARHTRRLSAVVVPALLAALLVGLLAGWLVRGDGVPPEATGTARIEVEGPEQLTVGEPATFTLRHLGVDSWVWVLPTGRFVTDEESITLTPTTPGDSTVVVRARDAQGRDLLTELEIGVSG